MLFKNENYHVDMICDLYEYLEGYQVVSVSIGPRNGYYILAVNSIPPRIDGMFTQTQTITPQNYEVIIIEWNNVYTVNIDNQEWNYHFVQPINDGILLACARAKYYSKDKHDSNCRIFNLDGVLIKEFLLGDGIQDLKVTGRNDIWTSYFDEGVFGNHGWYNPIGACGLRAWNENGEPVYTYNNSGSNFICDCYALNVVNDNEVWFYYYTDFLLGKISDGGIAYYDPKLSGSDGFLIYDRYALLRGGYDKQDEYHLLEFIKGGKLKENKIITFINETGITVMSNDIDYRGSRLLLRVGTKLYTVDLKDIVAKI